MGNQQGIATTLINLALIYQQNKKYTEALVYFRKSLEIFEKIGDQAGMADALIHLASIYRIQKNYPQTINSYEISLQIYQKIGEPSGICITYSNLAITFLHMGKPILAQSYAQKALKLAQEIKYLNLMQKSAEVLYAADSALGNWKSAFEHHKLYKQYSDSLHNEDKAKEFGRIESRYQFEKEAEDQKRKQAEAQRLAQLETDRRNNLQYLSIFAGLLVLFGGLTFVAKLKIPARVLDISLFAALLILFEFLLILFDPILDQYTGGIPVQKLVFNSVIALAFAPLHGFCAPAWLFGTKTKKTVF